MVASSPECVSGSSMYAIQSPVSPFMPADAHPFIYHQVQAVSAIMQFVSSTGFCREWQSSRFVQAHMIILLQALGEIGMWLQVLKWVRGPRMSCTSSTCPPTHGARWQARAPCHSPDHSTPWSLSRGGCTSFGGCGTSGRLSDLHSFDCESGTWEPLRSSEAIKVPSHMIASRPVLRHPEGHPRNVF